jgi:glutaredoxin
MFSYRQNTVIRPRSARHTLLATVIAAAFISHSAIAEVYRYTDENGRVVYSSQKPQRAESIRRVSIRHNTISSGDNGYSDAENRDVIIYTAEWCGYCKSAKAYFDELGIEYSEYDIEKSRQAYLDYKSQGGAGLPLILVGDQKMTGFSRAGFQRLYSPGQR